MYTLLQIDTQQCLDCVEHGLNKNLPEFITCAVTIAVGAIIRFFEKRKIKKEQNKI